MDGRATNYWTKQAAICIINAITYLLVAHLSTR